jgi:hypothetical protein
LDSSIGQLSEKYILRRGILSRSCPKKTGFQPIKAARWFDYIHLSQNPGRTVDEPDFDENPKNRKIKKLGVILLTLKHTPDRSIIHGIEIAHRKKHDEATCFFVCDAGNLELVAWFYNIKKRILD